MVMLSLATGADVTILRTFWCCNGATLISYSIYHRTASHSFLLNHQFFSLFP